MQNQNFIGSNSGRSHKLVAFSIAQSAIIAICFFLFSFTFQGGKGAPYYVGAAQTLQRGMYSDRNKNIIGKFLMMDGATISRIFFSKLSTYYSLSHFYTHHIGDSFTHKHYSLPFLCRR